jgi:hypothetical protein
LTSLALSVLGVGALIECEGSDTRALLQATCDGMLGQANTPTLRYQVSRASHPSPYVISRDGQRRVSAQDEAELICALDGEVAIDMQNRRADLYFVHAAVVELGGRAFMLAAESGTGKSTTAWALLHHGFGYLSDELGPIELGSLTVHPYPRALCLKREPPAPYPVPASVLRMASSIHISAGDLPGRAWREPLPLGATFFLRYQPGAGAPAVRRMTSGEGAARLYANTLNALAHQADGLEGAIRIAQGRPCFELVSAELKATATLVKRTARRLLQKV